MWKGGSEQQFLTAFPVDRVDRVDPVDPLENSRKHDFADMHNDLVTFARNLKFNFGNLVPGTKYLVPDTNYLGPGTKHLVPGT